MKEYNIPYENLYETLVESARKFPKKTAIIDDFEEVTYEELLRRVDEMASVLKWKYNLGEQQQVAILMVNSAKTLVAFYAVMKIGCIALMINTKFAEAEVVTLLEEMDAKLIISDSKWLYKIENNIQKLGIEAILTELNNFECHRNSVDAACVHNLENVAVIMHTSGTTGKPKGVMVTQRNILETSYGYQEVQGLDETAVTVLSVPLFHILGLSCVSTMFIHLGATIVLSEFYRADDVLWKIKRYKATHFHSVPAIYLQLLESDFPEKDLSSLKTAVCGGAPVSDEDIERFCKLAPNATVHKAYGMTETAGSGTLSEVHKGALKAVPNVEMLVVDENHNQLPPGEIGELVFCGPCVARRRWKCQGLSDDHMYSGDVGYMDEHGHVYVIDRLKDIINRGGEKIFPIQIEAIILQYPGIAKAAVYAVGNAKYGEVPAAMVVPDSDAHVDLNDLKQYLANRVAKYELPVVIETTNKLPVTQNGKVRKLELRKRAEERGYGI